MAVRKAVQLGAPVIRARAVVVENPRSAATKRIVRDLVDSMRSHGLVGMAAPQIGRGVRIFVTEVRRTKNRKTVTPDPLRVFINPTILKPSAKRIGGYEGCGSVAEAGLFGSVKRAQSLTIRAFNERGELFTLDVKGLLARIVQHEMDHLNGIVFIDRVEDTKTLLGTEAYRAMKRK